MLVILQRVPIVLPHVRADRPRLSQIRFWLESQLDLSRLGVSARISLNLAHLLVGVCIVSFLVVVRDIELLPYDILLDIYDVLTDELWRQLLVPVELVSARHSLG